MKKIIFLSASIISMMAVGCSNETENPIFSEHNEEGASNFIEEVVITENNILQFKDQATFDRYVSQGIEIENHVSLLDYYYTAMEEAEEFYERPGGYEEFKEKYSNLYFPEQDNDISAFLPVSDKNIATYLNEEGNVIIGGEMKNLIDINSYEQLKNLDLLFPSEDYCDFPEPGSEDNFMKTRASVTNWVSATYTVHGGDRRIWIKSGHKDKSSKNLIVKNGKCCNHVEVSFRKKGFLGQWYNYSSTTTLTIDRINDVRFSQTKSGTSSHDYYVPYCDGGNSHTVIDWGKHPHNTWGKVEYLGNIIPVFLMAT